MPARRAGGRRHACGRRCERRAGSKRAQGDVCGSAARGASLPPARYRAPSAPLSTKPPCARPGRRQGDGNARVRVDGATLAEWFGSVDQLLPHVRVSLAELDCGADGGRAALLAPHKGRACQGLGMAAEGSQTRVAAHAPWQRQGNCSHTQGSRPCPPATEPPPLARLLRALRPAPSAPCSRRALLARACAGHCTGRADGVVEAAPLPARVRYSFSANVVAVGRSEVIEAYERALAAFGRQVDPEDEAEGAERQVGEVVSAVCVWCTCVRARANCSYCADVR